MSRIRPDQPLIPSVLDRLLDDEPGSSAEAVKPHSQVLRELKQSVRRDLENLLNTRRWCKSWPPHLEELERSLVNYGIPDITGMDLASADGRQQFRRILEVAIHTFEPRFKSVIVEILENTEAADRALRFRIDGLLHAEPAPEPVLFDSSVEPATGSVEVRGTRS
jgi:type VI secretion system protein ImpF